VCILISSSSLSALELLRIDSGLFHFHGNGEEIVIAFRPGFCIKRNVRDKYDKSKRETHMVLAFSQFCPQT